MAIEVIPKPKIKEIPWANIVFYAVLAALLAFLLSYAFFIFYQQRLQAELNSLQASLARTASEKELEQNILLLKNRIEDSRGLLAQHINPSKVSDMLEQNTHPKVWFSDTKISFETGHIDISGNAGDLQVLSQQIRIFERAPFIHRVKVSKITAGREGQISFELQLAFDKGLLK